MEKNHQPICFGNKKLEWLPFYVVSKFQLYVLLFRHKARVWRIDGQTDEQNYDPQDRASIAVSRGKNLMNSLNII